MSELTQSDCFLVKQQQKWIYQSNNTLQLLQQGQKLENIVHNQLKQLYENLCYKSMYIQEILPLERKNISLTSLNHDRQGGIYYEICVQSDVIIKDIPELILVNCQIKEVNQKDDDIVQLICKGFGNLSDTNIYVFIENKQKSQPQFQVDQIMPSLIRKTVYQVGCPYINCFAQPMNILDSCCYYILKSTPKNQQDEVYNTNMEQTYQYLDNIKGIQNELKKYPQLLKEQFISIYSNNIFTLQAPQKNKDNLEMNDFIKTVLSNDTDKIIQIKLGISDYSNNQVSLVEQIPEKYIMTVQYDSIVLVEIAKDILFWLRFLLESCQVYTPKTIQNLKNILKQ